MIKFYIPDFYFMFDLNLKFIKLMKDHPEYFRENVSIGGVYGSFPGMIWNGGRVNNLLAGFSNYNNIYNTIAMINDEGIPIRLTATNLLIENKHLADTLGNTVLEIMSKNPINEIIVANDVMEVFIRDKYPDMKIVSSVTKCITKIEDLEKELTKDYYLVVPNIRFNNTKELLDISRPEKCEIMLNNSCSRECNIEKEHYLQISANNMHFSCNQPFICQSCEFKDKDPMYIIKNNPSNIDVDSLYNIYVKKGFKHFKIVGRADPLNRSIFYYIYYMVKPEYQLDVMSYLLT